jgi:ubiquinone/menaquinone biosynthesis C-methylase UbiE
MNDLTQESKITEEKLTNQHIVQSKFGLSADEYVTSAVHAKGQSLERLLSIADPQPGWRVLDVATGAGHTALAFSNKTAHVIAADLTFEMLVATRKEMINRWIKNVTLCQANAQNLPFKRASFDLIVCRLATHHFFAVDEFVKSAGRLLVPGGHLAIVDNIVPSDSYSRKRKKRSQDTAGYINAFEKLRDPSHQRCLSMEEWQELFYAAGFRLWHSEKIKEKLDFRSWATRMHVPQDDQIRLEVMLLQAPEEALAFLAPEKHDGKLTFTLTEAILVGSRDLH